MDIYAAALLVGLTCMCSTIAGCLIFQLLLRSLMAIYAEIRLDLIVTIEPIGCCDIGHIP